MGFFTKPVAEVETIPRTTPEQRLAEVEREYRSAERALTDACREVAAHNARCKDLRVARLGGDVCVLVNAMTRDPELQRLEAARASAQRRRDDLLGQRASLLKSLGKIK
jgi:hypothetical protein